jgi:hypothetical protein
LKGEILPLKISLQLWIVVATGFYSPKDVPTSLQADTTHEATINNVFTFGASNDRKFPGLRISSVA